MRVRCLHWAVRGRGRYRVDGLYRSGTFKAYLEAGLAALQGVQSVAANPLTGNILVYFDPHLEHADIAGRIEALRGQFCRTNRALPQLLPSRRPHQLANPIRSAETSVTPWHCWEAESVLRTLRVASPDGLSEQDVAARLQQDGPNALPGTPPRSRFLMFIAQFTSLPVLLLGAAAGLSLMTGGLVDAVVILSVVGLNAAIGYTTESRSERTFEALRQVVRPSAVVRRQGCIQAVRAEDIVVGDVLVLSPGSYVTADARLLEAQQLSIDEAVLTGESVPVSKTPEPLANATCPLAERYNMVYMGTFVTGGQGLAVVIATGQRTEMGRIHALVGEAEAPQTPMERQLAQMGGQLALLSSAVCGVVFGLGLLRGYGLITMLKSAISLAVAAVPEGLPTVATTTLALGIRNMRRHRVLIRQLDAVEALGSVQTVCLDKTGTLTYNRMSVVAAHVGMMPMTVADGLFRTGDAIVEPWEHTALMRLLQVVVLCNETEVESQAGGYALRGSSTENALMHMALCTGLDVGQLRQQYLQVRLNHRAEDRNYMTTLNTTPAGKTLLACKGSPAEVLELCTAFARDGQIIPLTEEARLAIDIENEQMAGRALRVLGVAYQELDDELDATGDPALIWLGLVGMADPLRPGVKDLIEVLHGAGIDTVMITGDQSATAYAIAHELHLQRDGQLEMLDSTRLTMLDPQVMGSVAQRVQVFARVSPAHKLQIVQALQQAGKVVAMTGDGINDSPALKAADIGIAMGDAGTDVAREVADVVIEDDDLETLVLAVSHGRTVYANIRKAVHFLLATNLSEIMVMLTALAVGLGHPLNAIQLLWINLISDVFPALALALEAPEPDVMQRPPRPPEVPIIKPADLQRIAFEGITLSAGAFGAYGYGLWRYGMGPRANTLSFLSLTSGQLLHAFSCRSEIHRIFDPTALPPNPYLTAAVGGSLALQGLALVIPGFRNLLGMTPITMLDSVIMGGSALLPLVINEATKPQPVDKAG